MAEERTKSWPQKPETGYLVEVVLRTGKLCERCATYEEARSLVEALPLESLLGMPLIFQELPDGSQRLVREDGKPLQWHRLPEDRPEGPDEPLPLDEGSVTLGELVVRQPESDEPRDDI